MWHWAERVFEIANAVLIFAVHMLTLYNEAHLTFVELAVLSLNFIVEASGSSSLSSAKECKDRELCSDVSAALAGCVRRETRAPCICSKSSQSSSRPRRSRGHMHAQVCPSLG